MQRSYYLRLQDIDFLGLPSRFCMRSTLLSQVLPLLAYTGPTSALAWNTTSPKGRLQGHHGAGKHRAPYAVPKPCCSACIVYRLFEDLISIEVREDTYFRGIHSNHFLTACVGFRDFLVSAGKSLPHARPVQAFHNGRWPQQKFTHFRDLPPGLIGVPGDVSVLLNTLLRTTN